MPEDRTTPRVLITAPYFQRDLVDYAGRFERRGVETVVPDVKERVEEDRLIELLAGIDGVIAGDDRFSRRAIEAADRLKVIVKWGTGVDSIDREACDERGIEVGNTPDAFTGPASDTVLSLILAFARRTLDSDRNMKGGAWKKLPGRALHECTLGIVGVGNIGSAVARKASAFGMDLLGNDVAEIPSDLRDGVGVRPAELPDLLEASDFVSINCDLNSTSRHLIDAEALARMPPSSVLVNTARGPIVDEEALVEALAKDDGIAGAGLDVFTVEPLPRDSPLRRMQNVILSPHNANTSPSAWRRVHESTLRQLFEALDR